MADRAGFEPAETLLPHTLSKREHSTTLPPVRRYPVGCGGKLASILVDSKLFFNHLRFNNYSLSLFLLTFVKNRCRFIRGSILNRPCCHDHFIVSYGGSIAQLGAVLGCDFLDFWKPLS